VDAGFLSNEAVMPGQTIDTL